MEVLGRGTEFLLVHLSASVVVIALHLIMELNEYKTAKVPGSETPLWNIPYQGQMGPK